MEEDVPVITLKVRSEEDRRATSMEVAALPVSEYGTAAEMVAALEAEVAEEEAEEKGGDIDLEMKEMFDSIPDATLAVSILMEAKATADPRFRHLLKYWTVGEGGMTKIRWGTPGDGKRCIRHLTKYIGPKAPGFCQNLHRKMVGGTNMGSGPGEQKAQNAKYDESKHKRDASGRFAVKRGDGYSGDKKRQANVKQVQAVLVRLGLLSKNSGKNGGVDGLFGPKTQAAVRAWQKRNGHKETGSIDSLQFSRLTRRDKIKKVRKSKDPKKKRKEPTPYSSQAVLGRGGKDPESSKKDMDIVTMELKEFTSALELTEAEVKAVRHVRTAAGAKRFGQPIGSVIVRDSPLKNLVGIESDYDGWDMYKAGSGRSEKRFYVGKYEGEWAVTDADDYKIHGASTQEDALKWLDSHVAPARAKTPTVRKTVARKPATASPAPKKGGESAMAFRERMRAGLKSNEKSDIEGLTHSATSRYWDLRKDGLTHSEAFLSVSGPKRPLEEFDSRDGSTWRKWSDGTYTVGVQWVSALGYEQARNLHVDWDGGEVRTPRAGGGPSSGRVARRNVKLNNLAEVQ
jgi:peptidoglycan hydrolase-like protein with peptidoglycan-binding domain